MRLPRQLVEGSIDSSATTLLVLAGILFGRLSAQDPTEPTSVADIAALAQRQLAAAQFVRGYSFTTVSRGEGADQAVVNESAVRFVRESATRRRAWLHFEHHLSVGADRTFREEMLEGYDGRVSWYDRRSTMLANKESTPRPTFDGSVSFSRRLPYSSYRCTGWYATLPGWGEMRDQDFLDVLQSPLVPFALRKEGDSVVLQCSSLGSDTVDEWYLKKEWGYCLHRHRRMRGDAVISTIEITSAVNLHPDLWYPSRIEAWQAPSRHDAGDSHHTVVDLTELELLASVPEDTFRPKFRPRTHVQVAETQQYITIGADDAELSRLLNTQAEEFRKSVHFPSRSGWWSATGWAGLGVVLCSIGCWLLLRRRRPVPRKQTVAGAEFPPRAASRSRSASLMLLALLTIVSARSAGAQDAWWFERSGVGPAENCALNSVLLAAAYHGLATTPHEVAQRLGCEPMRAKPVSLARIVLCLDALGFTTEGFRETSLAQVVQHCRERRRIAIIHTSNTKGDGHYYLVGPSGSEIAVANPTGRTFIAGPDDDRIRKLSAMSTGAGVMVGPTEDRKDGNLRVGPAEERADWSLATQRTYTLHAGPRPAGRRDYLVPLLWDGLRSWALLDHTASCGCVVGVEQLEAGLRVTIDGSRANEADEQVVTLRFHVGGVSESRELRVAFLAGSTEPSIARACVVVAAHPQPNTAAEGRARVDVIVPIGGCVKAWDSPSGATATIAEMRPVPGGVAVGYDLVWPGRQSRVNFVVRDQLGAEQVLQADLVAPTPTSR